MDGQRTNRLDMHQEPELEAGAMAIGVPVAIDQDQERIGRRGMAARVGGGLWQATEWVLSLSLIVFSLPLMAVLAVVIRLDSPGPAVFRQVRIGRNRRNGAAGPHALAADRRKVDLGGRPFSFYKFRTMFVDARERFPELYRYEYTPADVEKMRFKLADDPRLTRFGSWLRTTTLDELPNLVNVLKGDLRLVGPRPDIPEMIKYYTDEQRAKLSVHPGVTGLAQTGGRGILTFQETLEKDLEYVLQRSIWLDLRILGRTLYKALRRDGAF